MSKQETIVVTGGAGYIGSHAVLALQKSGWPVIVVDNLVTGVAALLPSGVPLVVADCGDAARMREIFAEHDVAAVMHFAASTVVPESVADPMKYYLNNTANTARLIDACVASGIGAFIYSSTAAVYGEPDVSAVSEDVPARPISPYGKGKLMGETMLADTARAHPLRFMALRYFNVAGADPQGRSGQSTPQATHLIKVACEVAAGKRPYLEIFGDNYDTPDGTCIRDYIHVSDLVDAHIAALEHLLAGGDSEIVNCGYGHGHSVREVVDAVCRETGIDIEARPAARRPGDMARLVCTSERIRELLGWQPRHDEIGAMVRTAYAWECRLRDDAGLLSQTRKAG